MPPLESEAYLMKAFQEIGRLSVGFSLAPLTWSEIDAYARQTGEIKEAFEAKLMRRMSDAYLSGLRHGEDDFSIAPWEG